MSWRRIETILRKDLKDAIRDARVLIALIVPFAFGLIYTFTFEDNATKAKPQVAISSPDPTGLPGYLATVAGDAVELTFLPAESPEQVRDEVAGGSADIGLILPPGFDASVRGGSSPLIEIVQRSKSGVEGEYVLAALEPALRLMSGQRPPAAFTLTVAAEDPSESAIEIVGLRKWSIVVAVLMMIGMIAMLAIPVVLSEEAEKKTLDALVLIASYAEVVTAKAALGLCYIAVSVPLLIALTWQTPVRPVLFAGGVAALGLALIGFGLLLGGLLKNANVVNTFSGFFLLPVIGPAFVIGTPAPSGVVHAAELTPSGAAMRLLLQSATEEQLFTGATRSFAVIAVWGLVAYALLLWHLSRRQA